MSQSEGQHQHQGLVLGAIEIRQSLPHIGPRVHVQSSDEPHKELRHHREQSKCHAERSAEACTVCPALSVDEREGADTADEQEQHAPAPGSRPPGGGAL